MSEKIGHEMKIKLHGAKSLKKKARKVIKRVKQLETAVKELEDHKFDVEIVEKDSN